MTDLSAARVTAFVYVADRERGVAFYRDALGLEHVGADRFSDSFALRGGALQVVAMPGQRAYEHPVFGLDVSDLSGTVRALKARGLACMIYPGMGQDEDGVLSDPATGKKSAWLADPDGNVVMLMQG